MDSTRVGKWARAGATAAVAVPAVGIGAATLWQAGAEGAALSLNQVFHAGSGIALLVLFCEFAVTISHSPTASRALLLGFGGFLGCLAAAIVVELFGPVALVALVVCTAGWAIRIALAGRRAADPQHAG
jgi:hypothetical protein